MPAVLEMSPMVSPAAAEKPSLMSRRAGGRTRSVASEQPAESESSDLLPAGMNSSSASSPQLGATSAASAPMPAVLAPMPAVLSTSDEAIPVQPGGFSPLPVVQPQSRRASVTANLPPVIGSPAAASHADEDDDEDDRNVFKRKSGSFFRNKFSK
jgi:hypothetical protein